MGIILIIIVVLIFKSLSSKNKESNPFYYNEKNKQYEVLHNSVNYAKLAKEKNIKKTITKEEKKIVKNVVHNNEISDLGYKICPKCGNSISKKSDVCFMCNHEFEDK